MKKQLVAISLFAIAITASAQQSTKRKFIDPANMDLSVKPGDNFYLYANGAWLKKTPIPDSKTRWGSFDILAEESSQALKNILKEAASTPAGKTGKTTLEQKVGDFYASGMDSLAIEKLGYQPIKKYLDAIARVPNKEALIKQINYLRSNSISSTLYRIGVGQDSKRVSDYIVSVGQGGTSLPDRDYYLKDDARSKTIRKDYVSYIVTLFKLVGNNDSTANAFANAVLNLETLLAQAQMSRVEMRDPNKLYNKFGVDDFSKKTGNINWKTTLSELGYDVIQDSLLCSNPKFIVTVDSLLNVIPLDNWKTYLQWNVLKDAAPLLSSDFVNASFAFNKTLSGQKVQTPRWQRMSGMVDGQLGELLGQLYVAKYFKPAAKKRMLELLDNMTVAFEERINQLAWMSPQTKVNALEKLKAFTKKIGYPDVWKKYDGVVIDKNDFYGNIKRCNQWRYFDNVNRLGKSVDKTEWGMTPPTVNAYYSPQKNEIVFPAGILQFPFFDENADDAINYGGIAAVIGHEMSHGFDDQGRSYDAEGNLRDWWTKSDADEFKKRADEVVAQYDGYTVLDTLHVNGKLTLGENIADLGGLSIAYEAFKKTKQFKENKKIDGFTPTQRFFLNWSQVWRSNATPQRAEQLIKTDNHSPGVHRSNGPLTNIDAFYEAFGVKQGDKMYKPKEKRTKIW